MEAPTENPVLDLVSLASLLLGPASWQLELARAGLVPTVGNPGDEPCHEWRQDDNAEQSLPKCVLECAG